MSKRLICLISFVLVLGMVSSVSAQLPEGWSQKWIGDETPPGSATYDAETETWTLVGHGWDIWGNNDDFQFAYQTLSGDGQITARVVTLAGDSSFAWSKVGVMIRETLDTASTHAMEMVTGGDGSGIGFEWRPATGGDSAWSGSTAPVVSPPYWVRVKRTGELFEGFHSPDGSTWEKEAEITISMATNVYIGLALTSHESGVTRTATFDNVLIERPKIATYPIPDDGAVLVVVGASLGWTAGHTAASHNVYFGTDYADVEAGTGDTFRGNQTAPYFLAGYGYTPNDPVPTGFVPGTTYYWRIEEVEADGVTKYPGNVWSFMLPDTKAYSPTPADEGKFIDPNADLSWESGFGAIEQTVYFGDDYDTVSTATTGGTNVGGMATTYDLGPLEFEKVYYWRVDTFGAYGPITGDVWSFKTMPIIPVTDPNLVGWWKLDEGQGTNALDWSGHNHHGALVNGPQWVPGYDGDALEFDGDDDYMNIPYLTDPVVYTICAWVRPADTSPASIIVRTSPSGTTTHWSHQLRINSSGTFEHYVYDGAERTVMGTTTVRADTWYHVTGIATDNGQMWLYVNGWAEGASASVGTMWVDGDRFVVGSESGHGMGWFDGLIDDVRIYDKILTQEEVKQAMRGDPLLAWDPSPSNGSTPDIDEAVPLSWSPGDNASGHDVYFGTDKDAVDNADTTDTTGIYRDRLSSTSYTPGEGVEWGGGPYYWRIDEYNTDGTISTGRLWSFTVADFISVDNFEGYDAINQIWYNWVDGLGFVKPDTPPNPGNGSGSEVGDPDTASFTEESIVHSGGKSMPFKYNNNDPFKLKYSEAKLTLSAARDWTKQGVKALSLWFRGYQGSVGSFTDNFDGTYSMTGSGADIWDITGIGTGFHDEFHFAYKTLTGAGTITARVDSVSAAHDWSKAGVMIRETLDPNSPHAFACVTPAQGVASQGRPTIGAASFNFAQGAGEITTPHWVKLERNISGDFTVSHSTDGSSWEAVTGATVQNIPMNTNVYVGLAVTSHDAALTCEAAFSNVTITGNVTGQWASQDIGITSNDAEPMYVAIANNTGQPAVIVHDDPNAAQINTWTEWNIELRDFAGINLADVNSIAVGLGNRNNPQAGGAGKMYFDDIALYRPRCVPEKLTLSEADLNIDCVVDFRDLEIMTGNWLAVEPDPDVDLEADLNSDGTVDFKDYAVLADDWLDEEIWPEL